MSETYTSIQDGIPEMGMSMFNVADSIPPQLYKFTLSIVLVLTISNTLVIKIVEGGENWKLLWGINVRNFRALHDTYTTGNIKSFYVSSLKEVQSN